MAHTGIHVGGGRVIHCSIDSVKNGDLTERWTHYAVPKGLYEEVKAMTILKKGSSGDEVKALQEKLKKLGYYTYGVDGSFGARTVEAVKAFQKDNGLYIDGIVGEKTSKKIDEAIAIPVQPSEPDETKALLEKIDAGIDALESVRAYLRGEATPA